MKRDLFKIMGTGAMALMLTIAFAQTSSFAQGRGARTLEGSWTSIITFRICQTGAPIRSFPGMNTFHQGGTMQEYGVGSGLLRGPGHGVWNHQGNLSFYSTFQFFRYNADGSYAGSAIARRQMEVDASGNHYSSTNTTDFLDIDGNVFMTGCATEAATRFQ
ncbi:MAG TPA: hypothetical protein PKD26_06765 [Pyrinomonadaceae bacterium]|nr:hypothetical protein [Pyrinomonadaceae bacterium]